MHACYTLLWLAMRRVEIVNLLSSNLCPQWEPLRGWCLCRLQNDSSVTYWTSSIYGNEYLSGFIAVPHVGTLPIVVRSPHQHPRPTPSQTQPSAPSAALRETSPFDRQHPPAIPRLPSTMIRQRQRHYTVIMVSRRRVVTDPPRRRDLILIPLHLICQYLPRLS